MEMSSDDERSRDFRSPTPPQSAAVPMDLYREQLVLNKGLQAELSKLNKIIIELKKELQELREERTLGKRRKKAKIATVSSSSSDEDEPRPTPPDAETHPQVPRAPQAPATAPEAPQDNRRLDGMDTTPAPPATSGTSEEAPKQRRTPPVILRKKKRWTAKLINDGIATILNFRKMALFNSRGEEYHTFTLVEDRQLTVVIRELPSGIPDQKIQEDLSEQGFPDAKVNRIINRRFEGVDAPGPGSGAPGPDQDPGSHPLLLARGPSGEATCPADGNPVPPLPEVRPRVEQEHRHAQVREVRPGARHDGVQEEPRRTGEGR